MTAKMTETAISCCFLAAAHAADTADQHQDDTDGGARPGDHEDQVARVAVGQIEPKIVEHFSAARTEPMLPRMLIRSC